MSRKAALIILYHGAEHAGNIPVLEKYYGGNFSHIWHLVPDLAPSSPEAAPNVISVQGAHIFFHGWIAQGLRHYFRDDYTHYFFVQDDLLLNPVINEENFVEYLGLDDKDCSFFPGLNSLYEFPPWGLEFRRSCSFQASTPPPPPPSIPSHVRGSRGKILRAWFFNQADTLLHAPGALYHARFEETCSAGSSRGARSAVR